MRWIGVDVGGSRKRFDVAVVDEHELVSLQARQRCADVVVLVEEVEPAVVAIDSPRCCALPGKKLRECERRIAREICGIRWTPDATAVLSSSYYEWVVEGLALHASLGDRDVDVIEVFPTASWTRWVGRRGSRSRARWTHEGLAMLGLHGVPARTNQDQRDAIAAALTARQRTGRATEEVGEIVVPLRSQDPSEASGAYR
jgi:predicted nuclease with RNAse H fold